MRSLTPKIRRGPAVTVTPGLPAEVSLRLTFWLVPPSDGPMQIQIAL